MLTEAEIKNKGFEALINALGDLCTEKFISLMLREPFDYTRWSKELWHGKTVSQISKEAMDHQAFLDKERE
jgi:hypothetical protein